MGLQDSFHCSGPINHPEQLLLCSFFCCLRNAWSGLGDLGIWRSLSPIPCSMQHHLPWVVLGTQDHVQWVLDVSEDGDSTTYLGRLCQCWIRPVWCLAIDLWGFAAASCCCGVRGAAGTARGCPHLRPVGCSELLHVDHRHKGR